jgi:hypothetical protein
MAKKNKEQQLSWHENWGARILLPSKIKIKSPFPELYATMKKDAMTFLAMITADDISRQAAEEIISEPLFNNYRYSFEAINSGTINSPFKGQEIIVQQYDKIDCCYWCYHWERILYLDDSTDTIAFFRANVDGLFSDSQEMLQTIMDSFSWDREHGVALKMDGDEIAFRARYAPKRKKKKVKPGSVPQLPPQIGYLQPFLEELATYPPEEINEDLDTALLENLIETRTKGLSAEDAKSRLMEDEEILGEWIDEDKIGRSNAAFIQGAISGQILYG